jgi:hypothetical protein
MSARTQPHVRTDAGVRPGGRIFTASADGRTRPQGKRGRERTSGLQFSSKNVHYDIPGRDVTDPPVMTQ